MSQYSVFIFIAAILIVLNSFSRVVSVESLQDVEAFFAERIFMLQNTYGVLLLLYSVICSKVQLTFLNPL